METISEHNGLDIALIHPNKSAMYSPNLYKWLTSPSRKHRAWTSRVYKDREGTLWVGMLDLGDLIGQRLMHVLCNGAKTESAAWCGLKGLTEVGGFWKRYIEVGRCAIDPAHREFFVGGDTRYKIDGDLRTCLWCGATHKRVLTPRTVMDETWESL